MPFFAIEKITSSPSRTLMVWIGSFIAGIVAATLAFGGAINVAAAPAVFGGLALAVIGGLVIKNKAVRLLAMAVSLFIAAGARYWSSADDPVNLLAYLPALAAAKAWLVNAVGQMLPEPHAGFLDGLLVGGGAKSPELKAAFVATGTAHVMALSGWNITLISSWFDKALILSHFNKKSRWILTTAAVIVFVIMTGAGASLVRAALMAIVATIAASSGRRSSNGRAVIYAAVLMLLVSPRIITADIGFLLSVFATLGMVYLSPFFKPFADRLPDRFDLRKTVAGTLAATLATLPVALVAFGQFSLVALPTNLLLLPFVAPTMAVGFSGAVLAALAPPLAAVCSYVTLIFTDYDISVVKLFARIPGASITGLNFNLFAAALMTAGMAAIVIKYHDQFVQKKS